MPAAYFHCDLYHILLEKLEFGKTEIGYMSVTVYDKRWYSLAY